MRKGLYANIHAKRKRGGKMRKKGAKGAPTKYHKIVREYLVSLKVVLQKVVVQSWQTDVKKQKDQNKEEQ